MPNEKHPSGQHPDELRTRNLQYKAFSRRGVFMKFFDRATIFEVEEYLAKVHWFKHKEGHLLPRWQRVGRNWIWEWTINDK